jgi:CDP-diacylglycerol--glycerol-3-phosphate 3-phosphatidyltransferase
MANALSILRLLLVVPLLWSLQHDGANTSFTTVAVLLVAALSDLADGHVARRCGRASPLGRILDPVADKLFVGGLGIGLFVWRQFPGWLLAGILLRDVAIVTAGCYLLRVHGLVISPNYLGKYATASLIVVSLAYLLPVQAWLRGTLACLAGSMLVASSVGYALVLRRSLGARRQPLALPQTRQCRSA